MPIAVKKYPTPSGRVVGGWGWWVGVCVVVGEVVGPGWACCFVVCWGGCLGWVVWGGLWLVVVCCVWVGLWCGGRFCGGWCWFCVGLWCCGVFCCWVVVWVWCVVGVVVGVGFVVGGGVAWCWVCVGWGVVCFLGVGCGCWCGGGFGGGGVGGLGVGGFVWGGCLGWGGG
ncbi:hypothetical protein, partial [Pseudomonas syringae group genomosp. 7]|uniref:hypothetical protein n=1 Tax=Pseudomonas syringae group genomosp. 7 TaxID=251699 RepID=UPI00376F6943